MEDAMAKCTTCGTEVSFFNIERECQKCTEQRKERQREAQRALELKNKEEQRIAEQKKRQQLAASIANSVRITRENVAQYGATTLLHDVYLPVDSLVNNEKTAFAFTANPIRKWTVFGWKVVATIPKTVGVALRNTQSGTFGSHYGGGIGGNVEGVYVLLQLEITTETIDRQIKAIEAYYEVYHGGSAD
jgi:predicted  nucleic acid-binding Zn-ribbon protein